MNTLRNTAVEFRHNDDALGLVYDSGAVEVHDDILHGEARFWMGWAAVPGATIPRRQSTAIILAFKRSVS